MIEFDNFIETYEGDEQKYAPDGVHPTDEYYHKYGAFIGDAIWTDTDARRGG